MKQSTKTTLTIVLPILVVVGGLVALAKNNQPGGGEYEGFAQCLTDQGAVFYGASWCPHCADQKRLFGSAIKNVNYVECALPGNRSAQTQECQDANIESYPTWEFSDGSRRTGVVSLSALAEKTGCELPTQ